MQRHVESRLLLEVADEARLGIQVAVARLPGLTVDERLAVTIDGRSAGPEELTGPVGGRLHQLIVPRSRVEITYSADVSGRAEPQVVTDLERFEYLRPSRYVEADRLAAEASADFGELSDPRAVLDSVSSWVGTRLDYVPGSSGPTDGAVDTMLARSGVCRDYAHLVAALLRARDVPARVVAVYAPGLSPMDFHAVVEAEVEGRWQVVDATLLAPRQSFLRIATGRDAADTAFLSNYGGNVDLLEVSVSAWTEGDLPAEDVSELVSLG